ncbi:unnamed protein product [Schistocephalus solidus]|uniref:Transmembrane protein 151B n=1 Tax=Schistocephalus solidus TaxID=70667 RepID=A0A183SD11_SCHSO|nr:unnamed protein product [Schistocephalus solidus]
MSLPYSICLRKCQLISTDLRESKALLAQKDRFPREQPSIKTLNTTAIDGGYAAAQTFTPAYCQPVHYCLMASLLTMFYLVYLLECWNCQSRQSLTAALNLDDVAARIRRAVSEEPTLWWIAFSYHFVRRVFREGACKRMLDVRLCQYHHCRPKYVETTRLQLSPGTESSLSILPEAVRRQPPSSPRACHVMSATLQTCAYDRVITHVRQCFLDAKAVGGWEDQSPAICWTVNKPATNVTFSKEFAFSSETCRLRYEELRRRFEQRQETKDDFLEIKEGFQLANESEIPPSVLLFPDKEHAPIFMRPKFFLLASLLLVSWPLRLLIYSQTAILHYSFRKIIGQSPGSCSSAESNSQLQTPTQHICLRNAYEACGRQTEINEGTVLEDRASKGSALLKHSRYPAWSDTDDELLSIDIRFNPSASFGTSTDEGNN